MKTVKNPSRLMRQIPVWFLVAVVIASGAGAATGKMLSGQVGGKVPLAVSQSILIDHTQFGIDDLSAHAKRRFVSVSDDRTAFTAAAEIATGDELVIDVPLINVGNTDASVELRLEAPPPLITYAEPFWKAETYVKSLIAGTITPRTSTPSPAPVTATLPQSSDTTPAAVAPSGVAGSSPQVSDGIPTTSSPGLPVNSAKVANSASTNIQPAGSATIGSQSVTTGTGPKPLGATGTAGEFIISTVDSAGNVGVTPSVAAVPDTTPGDGPTVFISYYDQTFGDLKFAKSTDGGLSWATSTVDGGPEGVGIWSSIAAVDANIIFISYQDLTNGDLKFAKSTKSDPEDLIATQKKWAQLWD